MGEYADADLVFEHPDDWDRNVIVAFAASPAPDAANIMMTRDAMHDQTLRQHIQRKLRSIRTMRQFDLLESSEATLGGVDGWRLRFTYDTESGVAEQTVTYVQAPGDVKRVTTFVTTVKRDEAESVRAFFDAALASVQFGPRRG